MEREKEKEEEEGEEEEEGKRKRKKGSDRYGGGRSGEEREKYIRIYQKEG